MFCVAQVMSINISSGDFDVTQGRKYSLFFQGVFIPAINCNLWALCCFFFILYSSYTFVMTVVREVILLYVSDDDKNVFLQKFKTHSSGFHSIFCGVVYIT